MCSFLFIFKLFFVILCQFSSIRDSLWSLCDFAVFGCLHREPWRLCYACDDFVFPQLNFLLLCEPFANLFSPFVSFFHHFCLNLLLFVVILCHYSFFRMLSILVIILHDFSFVFVFFTTVCFVALCIFFNVFCDYFVFLFHIFCAFCVSL